MPARGTEGFTLLEVLVALAVIGLLTATAATALRGVTRVWHGGEERLSASAQVSLVQGLLRRQIAGAFPIRLPAEPVPVVAFAGTEQSMAWIARRPAKLAAPGLYVVTLRFDSNGGEGRLIGGWRLLDRAKALSEQLQPEETVVLMEGIRRAAIGYFAGTEGGPGSWRSEWRAGTTMPSLVRVQLQPTADSRWQWPELLIAPRLGSIPG